MDKIDDIIDSIVSFEWDMFQAVNEFGPRSSCQNDHVTFKGMRRAQFSAWPPEACASYFNDLANAALNGRNLVKEKYIHMMKHSAPAQYEKLSKYIPMPQDSIHQLAQEISDKLLEQTEALFEHFPYISRFGRPLRLTQDTPDVTSIETYQLGELLTYSMKTLLALKRHLLELGKEGKSLARAILENSARYYGYKTLEDAEAAMKAQICAHKPTSPPAATAGTGRQRGYE